MAACLTHNKPPKTHRTSYHMVTSFNLAKLSYIENKLSREFGAFSIGIKNREMKLSTLNNSLFRNSISSVALFIDRQLIIGGFPE